MRMSRQFGTTLRSDPSDAGADSHRWLMRAGYIRAAAPGTFSYLPLGRRALARIEAALRCELESIGAQEVALPMAMTNAEQAATLAAGVISSYRQLPAVIYQIQRALRDETRPRGGPLRACEILRLDCFAFTRTRDERETRHDEHRQAFRRALERLGLGRERTLVAEAAAHGTAEVAEEIIFRSTAGDARAALCGSCGYVATLEAARFTRPRPPAEPPLPMDKVATPGADTIEALAAYLGVPKSRTAKCVFFSAELAPATAKAPPGREVVVMALVRGDMEAGVAKLRRAVGAARLRPADAAAVRSVGAAAGYASPVGLAAEALHVVVDELVAVTPNLVSGANEPGYHLLNVCCGRDYQPHQVADIAVAFQGAECPRCAAPLEIGDSVELASLQGLGPELSQALGATYQARDGHARPLWIGWYALELDRLLACIAEGHRDEHGLTLPASVAPYAVYLIALGGDAALAERADRLYAELRGSGLDVLYDDRDVSAGVKFNDADLVGIPLRITVSARGLQEDMIELKLRGTAARQAVPGREAAARARELIARLEAREPGRAG